GNFLDGYPYDRRIWTIEEKLVSLLLPVGGYAKQKLFLGTHLPREICLWECVALPFGLAGLGRCQLRLSGSNTGAQQKKKEGEQLAHLVYLPFENREFCHKKPQKAQNKRPLFHFVTFVSFCGSICGMRRVTVIDSHTGGEPTRVVISGGPELGNDSLANRRERFKNDHDDFRRAIVNEPRGTDAVIGALLCAPVDQSCVTGIIFFDRAGYLNMCGHGTIGLVASLSNLY